MLYPSGGGIAQDPESDGKQKTGDRTCNRNLKLGHGMIGLPSDLSHPSKHKQRNGADRDALGQRHQAMRKLMEKDGGKEEQTGGDPNGIMFK